MAIATMSSYAHTTATSTDTDMAPMGVFVPTTPLVVRREKRRRRRQDDASTTNKSNKTNDSNKKRRHGFVFDARAQDEATVHAAASRPASASSSTFVFRVRKDAKPTTRETTTSASSSVGDVDASNVTTALLKKKERELKRVRLQQRKAAMVLEKQHEAALMETYKLTNDQLQLYYAVRDQVKREMRKTMRDFARSAARADILQLTEKSLEAIKSGVVEFMAENAPSRTVETVANPENERLRALIESYKARIQELETEENDWRKMKDSINTTIVDDEPSEPTDGESKETESSVEPTPETCELSVTREIKLLQRAAIEQVESSALRLQVIQDSMASIDRWALQAEIKKSQLFDAFHGSAFKGYVQDSKEALRTLLRLE